MLKWFKKTNKNTHSASGPSSMMKYAKNPEMFPEIIKYVRPPLIYQKQSV